MTHELHRELGHIGAIRIKRGVHGPVAEKGGFGSGFIELATRTFLRILSFEDAGIDTHEEIAQAIRDILDPEEVKVVKSNLLKIAEYL